jgi:hypothetical protein
MKKFLSFIFITLFLTASLQAQWDRSRRGNAAEVTHSILNVDTVKEKTASHGIVLANAVELLSTSATYGLDMNPTTGLTIADLRLHNGALLYNHHTDTLRVTEANTRLVGNLFQTSGTGAPGWGHSPVFGVKGIAEFDANTFIDANLTVADSANIGGNELVVSHTDNRVYIATRLGIGNTNPLVDLYVSGDIWGTGYIYAETEIQSKHYRSGSAIASLTLMDATFGLSSGQFKLINVPSAISNSGTAGYTGFYMNITESALGSGDNYLLDIGANSTSYLTLTNAGVMNTPNIYNGVTGEVSNWNTIKIYNDSTVAGETTLTDVLPAGYIITNIIFKNTTANAITNLDIGFSDGGGEIVAAGNVTANDEGSFTILQKIDDFDASDTVYISATNWNSANLIIYVKMERVF